MSALALKRTRNSPPIESTPNLRLVVDTGAADNAILASVQSESKDWDTILRTLHQWGTQPEGLEAEDFSPPTYEAIVAAADIAVRLKMDSCPMPFRCAPSADEGVVFEWKYGEAYRTLEVLPDGTMEFLEFQNNELKRTQFNV
ncbi:MAG TPA: hypothetical protein VM008_02535 [Phycisphaerae bacterium]|nr:hypothetical protein [Phycisphaerae bacterium]